MKKNSSEWDGNEFNTPSFNELKLLPKTKNQRFKKLELVSKKCLLGFREGFVTVTQYNTVEGDEVYRFLIPIDIKELLLDSKTPKKPELFNLPFKNIFLDVSIENDKVSIPYGFYLSINDDIVDESDDDRTKEQKQMGYYSDREFNLYFCYYLKGFEDNPLNFIHLKWYGSIEPILQNTYLEELFNEETRNIFSNSKDPDNFYQRNYKDFTEKEKKVMDQRFKNIDTSGENYFKKFNYKDDDYLFCEDRPFQEKYWKLLNLKHITCFICNYLLHLNDPNIRTRVHQGRHKKFEKDNYIFKKPKTTEVILNNQLLKYIDDYKYLKSKANFKYLYRFMVRGHFRTLRNKRYKNLGKKIWIPPFMKGKGVFYKKDYRLEKDK